MSTTSLQAPIFRSPSVRRAKPSIKEAVENTTSIAQEALQAQSQTIVSQSSTIEGLRHELAKAMSTNTQMSNLLTEIKKHIAHKTEDGITPHSFIEGARRYTKLWLMLAE